MKLIEHFVNGKIIPGSSDKKGKVFNPATGEQESEVRLASKSDLDEAVEVAKKAFETWSLKPPLQRARVIFKFKELIEKNSDELDEWPDDQSFKLNKWERKDNLIKQNASDSNDSCLDERTPQRRKNIPRSSRRKY